MAPASEQLEMEVGGNAAGTVAAYSYEEALELSGQGAYNLALLGACFVVIVAMGIDIFGLGIIATAATCDLGMTLSEIGILSSMPFAGIILMSYCWGYVSDRRGRLLALRWAMTGSFISAVLSSLAPSWQLLAALRFLGSALSSAAESATYALLAECCVQRVRARYMLLVTSALMLTPTLYYVTGYLIMKWDFTFQILGISYRPWRLLTLIMALPLGLGALLLSYLSESPKFLANVGRSDEAVEVLKRIYKVNRISEAEYPVKKIFLDEGNKEEVTEFSARSLWMQIAPLFSRPLLRHTLLLFYLTFVAYIANNSFAIILPTIFNVFFTSYGASGAGASFCDLFRPTNSSEGAASNHHTQGVPACANTIDDNTIWAGCAHGLSFFILNALLSQCAGNRRMLTIVVLTVAATAAIAIDLTGDPVSGLVLFYVFLTTAMLFGIISSYLVDLYPTSHRGMVACLGMMVARLSAFAGTNMVGSAVTLHCTASFYGAAALLLSGAVVAWFLPPDGKIV